MTTTCECGRPAVALPRHKRGRARGKPRRIKGHSLCWECFDKERNRQRAVELATNNRPRPEGA